MSFDFERFYELLPAVYRLRDAELTGQQGGLLTREELDELQALQSSTATLNTEQEKRRELLEKKQRGPLKALLSVIAEQVAVLEEDINQLYDDQFIETCTEWVVPYIGDLLGVRGLHPVSSATFSQRAYVANTIAHRRRKGTAAMLEQLARDVTGWNARVVEFFQRLATTQYMNHLRPDNLSMASVRHWKPLEDLDTPFDSMAHTADVRRIASRCGRYNIPNIGVFLWRLDAYSLTGSPAVTVDGDGRRYMFSPLGNNMPLFTFPKPEIEITHLADPINVPMPISRLVLAASLNNYYGKDKSIFITVDGEEVSDPIIVCDLSDVEDVNGAISWAHMPSGKVAIDPVLGRIAFPTDRGESRVLVTFHYGFSADVGGGQYPRVGSFELKPEQIEQIIEVPQDQPTTQAIQQAIEALTNSGVIEITDSGRYEGNLAINVAAGQHIELRAADGRRPTLVLSSDMTIHGEDDAEVILNGLLIIGGTLRVSGKLRRLRLSHCTLVPGLSISREGTSRHPDRSSLILDVEPGDKTAVEIDHSIVGPLRLPAERSTLAVQDSVIDSPARDGQATYCPALVSGDIDRFPILEPAGLAFDITIGGEGPYRAALAAVPRDLIDASAQLEAAIRAAHTSPAFARARVITAERRLVVLPGSPGDVFIQATGTDAMAIRLGLVRPPARRVHALVGGTLSPVLTLRSSALALNVTMGAEGPHQATLASTPANLDEARVRLQEAIRAAHSDYAFRHVLVARMGDQLVVLPGTEEAAVVLNVTPDDRTTLVDLALESDRPAIAATDGGEQPGPQTTMERTTVIGAVYVKELRLASDTVFTDRVVSTRRQEGCVRFSYVPEGSYTPRRYRCQPLLDGGDLTRIRPDFTSLRYGDPGYCQLSQQCAPEIRQGASDEAEMGVFHNLYQPQRETNLRVRLEEYLRFALEAGIFYVT